MASQIKKLLFLRGYENHDEKRERACRSKLCQNLGGNTVCVPYYKATPYNISHPKNFSMAIFTLIFFL